MAKPMDVTLYNIHGFCHGTMGKPITWQNPYIMSFAMVYGFCHRSMAKPMGYPIPAWTRGDQRLTVILDDAIFIYAVEPDRE